MCDIDCSDKFPKWGWPDGKVQVHDIVKWFSNLAEHWSPLEINYLALPTDFLF